MESVKAASDVYMPVSGEVVEVNGVSTSCAEKHILPRATSHMHVYTHDFVSSTPRQKAEAATHLRLYSISFSCFIRAQQVQSNVTVHSSPLCSTLLCVSSLAPPLQDLEGSPEIVNESPYEKGWFVKIKVRAEACCLLCHVLRV